MEHHHSKSTGISTCISIMVFATCQEQFHTVSVYISSLLCSGYVQLPGYFNKYILSDKMQEYCVVVLIIYFNVEYVQLQFVTGG